MTCEAFEVKEEVLAKCYSISSIRHFNFMVGHLQRLPCDGAKKLGEEGRLTGMVRRCRSRHQRVIRVQESNDGVNILICHVRKLCHIRRSKLAIAFDACAQQVE